MTAWWRLRDKKNREPIHLEYAMSLRNLLIVNAFLATFHGLGFLLIPTTLLGLYQIEAGSGAQLMGQLFGAELIVVAVITWLGRNLTDAPALRAIVLGNLLADIAGTVVSIKAVLSGTTGPAGWLAVAIYGLLAIGYIAVQLRPRVVAA